MADMIGPNKPDMVGNVLFGMVILSLCLLFAVVVSRAASETPEKYKSDCAKRGGVLIERQSILGLNYDCEARLD